MREIDALGGLMGPRHRCELHPDAPAQREQGASRAGPARAQADKRLYARLMKETLEQTPNLHLHQAMVERIVPPHGIENAELGIEKNAIDRAERQR